MQVNVQGLLLICDWPLLLIMFEEDSFFFFLLQQKRIKVQNIKPKNEILTCHERLFTEMKLEANIHVNICRYNNVL